jgi:hypothetical protein
MRCYSNLRTEKIQQKKEPENDELATNFSRDGASAPTLFQKKTQLAQPDRMVRNLCFWCGRHGSDFGIRDLRVRLVEGPPLHTI